MKHYVITRFSAGINTQPVLPTVRNAPSAEEWFQHRLTLFEEYTASSMVAQTAPFHWVLSVDPQTPRWVMNGLRSILKGVAHTVLPSDSYDHIPQVAWVADQVRRDGGDRVIMTRLDSDDGLHRDYLEAVQDIAKGFLGVIDLTRGIWLNHRTHIAQRVNKQGRPFVSLVEDCSKPLRGVFCAYHNRLAKKVGSVRRSDHAPPWLETFHEYNKASRARIDSGLPWSRLSGGFR